MKYNDILMKCCKDELLPYIFPATDRFVPDMILATDFAEIRKICNECISKEGEHQEYAFMCFLLHNKEVCDCKNDTEFAELVKKIKNQWTTGFVSDDIKKDCFSLLKQTCQQTIELLDFCEDTDIQKIRNNVSDFLSGLYKELGTIELPVLGRIFDKDANVLYLDADGLKDGAWDFFALYADALRSRFMLSQYDMKNEKASLFHCMQRLWYEFEYRVAPEQLNCGMYDEEVLRLQQILDMITGRDSAVLEEGGKIYVSKASLKNNCFVLSINEGNYWNFFNVSKDFVKFDEVNKTVSVLGEKVVLDNTHYALYVYFFNLPYKSLEKIWEDRDTTLSDVFLCFRTELDCKDKSYFVRHFQKRISEINKIFRKIYGDAFAITKVKNKEGEDVFYIPISVGEWRK